MGVSEPALSTKEGQFAVGELLAVDDVNAPADCAYVAKFTVSKDTDDPIPIVFMHHVCMRAGRGLVREATDALQELGIDAGSKSAQEVLLRQLVSKFVAFTEDEINRTDFTGARQFTELHSRHEAHSWPSSLFSVAVDGLSLELRLFNKEPVNQRITFFCKTLLLPEVRSSICCDYIVRSARLRSFCDSTSLLPGIVRTSAVESSVARGRVHCHRGRRFGWRTPN